MDLETLIHGLDIRLRGDPRTRVRAITEDSRSVLPGSLFIARRGTRADGSRFIPDALRAGASAILTDADRDLPPIPESVALLTAPDVPRAGAIIAERFYGNPSRALSLVGVTGTNGKTTAAHALRDMLNHAGRPCGLIGTVEIDDGVGRARASMTTPPAIELSRTLALMRDAGRTCAAIEVSSHALDQRRADGLGFDAAVFTNLTGDHQDYHASFDDYASAKARLFESLDANAVAIVNGDDPHADRMLRDCRANVVRCSRDTGCDAHVRVINASLSRTTLALAGPWGSITGSTRLVGAHNAMNLLQAACAAHALGLDDVALAGAIGAVEPPRGRLERVADRPAVFIDFAHTDDALKQALRAVRDTDLVGQLWVVFGAGGNKDRDKRPRMGEVAADLADRVVLTSDNPRRERPTDIIDDIFSGIPPRERARVRRIPDREQAIRETIANAAPEDTIVIAGKGHELEQELMNDDGEPVVIPFDDAAIARDAATQRLDHAGAAP